MSSQLFFRFILLSSLLLTLLLSLSSLVTCQSTPTVDPPTVLRVAALVHGPGQLNFSTPLSSTVILSSLKTSASPTAPLVAIAVQAWTLWSERVNALGGLKNKVTTGQLNNNGTAPQNITVVIDFFDVGPLSAAARTIRNANTLASFFVSNSSTLSVYPVIFTPVLTIDAVVLPFMLSCDATDKCLVFNPMSSAPSLYMCLEPYTSDCIMNKKNSKERRFSNTFSVLFDPTHVLTAHTTLFKQNKVSNVAIVISGSDFSVFSLETTLDILFDLGMKAVYIKNLNNVALTNETAAVVIDEIAASSAEVIYYLSTSSDSVGANSLATLLLTMKMKNYTPKGFAVGGGADTASSVVALKSDGDYIFGSQPWSPLLKGANYKTTSSPYSLEIYPSNTTHDSPAVFADIFTARWSESEANIRRFGDTALIIAALANQAGTMLDKFIESSENLKISSLRQAASTISSPSVYHKLQLDVFGRTVPTDELIYQTINGTKVLITPYAIGKEPVFPMPTWDERNFSPAFYTKTSEKVMISITCVALFYSLVMLGLVIYQRHHDIIRASTPTFCCVVLVGGMLMLISNFCDTLYTTNDLCMTNVWLLTLGFTSMFASLFAKTWRVWKIFHSGIYNLKQIEITQWTLFLQLMFPILCADLILNICWTVISPIVTTTVVPDIYRPSNNYVTCSYDPTTSIFIYVTLSMKGLLIVFGIILTWLARGVPDQFNESSQIGTCIYNVAIICAFAVPMIALNSGTNREIIFQFKSYAIIVLVITTLSILFLPKFYHIYYHSSRHSSTGLGTGGAGGNQGNGAIQPYNNNTGKYGSGNNDEGYYLHGVPLGNNTNNTNNNTNNSSHTMTVFGVTVQIPTGGMTSQGPVASQIMMSQLGNNNPNNKRGPAPPLPYNGNNNNNHGNTGGTLIPLKQYQELEKENRMLKTELELLHLETNNLTAENEQLKVEVNHLNSIIAMNAHQMNMHMNETQPNTRSHSVSQEDDVEHHHHGDHEHDAEHDVEHDLEQPSRANSNPLAHSQLGVSSNMQSAQQAQEQSETRS